MAPKHDIDHGYHNPSNPQRTTSVDCKLITHKNEYIPSKTMKNEDNIDIMNELSAMIQPPNQLRLSMPESILHRISKMVIKEAVEDKTIELM